MASVHLHNYRVSSVGKLELLLNSDANPCTGLRRARKDPVNEGELVVGLPWHGHCDGK